MDVRITVRHGNADDGLRDYVEEKLEPLGRFNRHARSIEVVLDEDHLQKKVEVIAHLDKGAPVVVHAHHEDARAAVDLVHDKLERMLRKLKEKLQDQRQGKAHHSPDPVAHAAADSGADSGDETGSLEEDTSEI